MKVKYYKDGEETDYSIYKIWIPIASRIFCEFEVSGGGNRTVQGKYEKSNQQTNISNTQRGEGSPRNLSTSYVKIAS
jgi:hypothetical protein